MLALRNELQLRATGEPQCPLCRDRILEDDAAGRERLFECGGCETVYHHECAVEMNGCATLGCAELGRAPSREASARFTISEERRRELRRKALTHDARRARREAWLADPRRNHGQLYAACGLIAVSIMAMLLGSALGDAYPAGSLFAPLQPPAWVGPTITGLFGLALVSFAGGALLGRHWLDR